LQFYREKSKQKKLNFADFFQFFVGLQRSLSVLAFTRHYQKPEVAKVAEKGDSKDLKNSLQGSRRAGTSGRLLPQSRGLVGAECFGSGTWQLCVSVECLYKSSKLITQKHFLIDAACEIHFHASNRDKKTMKLIRNVTKTLFLGDKTV
jgi:hypothetical protein